MLPTLRQKIRGNFNVNSKGFSKTKRLTSLLRARSKFPLQASSGPITIRFFRYPYFWKQKIEKLTGEILEQEVIKSNRSPFSSLVLLVKKGDDIGRFYIKYWILNRVTIIEKFATPVIKELLDKLHGFHWLKKLNLKFNYYQIRMHPEDDQDFHVFQPNEWSFYFLVYDECYYSWMLEDISIGVFQSYSHL